MNDLGITVGRWFALLNAGAWFGAANWNVAGHASAWMLFGGVNLVVGLFLFAIETAVLR